ncbi:hypothetical protein [Taibaiella koreensis]|uniref:hypothetical protein n=1 Tax=Taibaiella koreensis TaxID=1268548 RepID=UPI0013C3206F|nr:hypothetical protein [Taibaiella koreensis]
MKRYLLSVLTAAIPALFAGACSNHDNTNESDTDTSVNTLPAETTPSSPETAPARPGDTAIVPHVDPALDSAAKQGTMPPK